MLDRLQNGLTPADPWISVDERLPDVNVSVLIRYGNGYDVAHRSVEYGWYDGDKIFYCDYDVTHWQPIVPPRDV